MNILTCEDDIFEWYIIGIKSLEVPQSSCIKIRKTIYPSRQYYASPRVLFSAEQKNTGTVNLDRDATVGITTASATFVVPFFTIQA